MAAQKFKIVLKWILKTTMINNQSDQKLTHLGKSLRNYYILVS